MPNTASSAFHPVRFNAHTKHKIVSNIVKMRQMRKLRHKEYRCLAQDHRSVSRSVVSDSLLPHGLQPTRLLCPCYSLGKNTGVGGHFLC